MASIPRGGKFGGVRRTERSLQPSA